MGVFFYNSAFINEEDLIINGSNRAFNYGDGFFETIKIVNKKPFNLSTHYARYSFACLVLKIENSETEKSLLSIISELIKQNKIVNGSVKVQVFRKEGGKYSPNHSSSEILIIANKGLGFEINKPISLCIFSDEVKTKGKISNIKSLNSLVSVLGSIYAKEFDFGGAILMNTAGNYIETTNSNIFIVKKGVIYSPPLSDGCVDGTMRNWVFSQENIIEKSLIQVDIEKADEVFTTNAITGITSVNIVEEIGFSNFDCVTKLQKKLISLSSDL